MEILSLSLRYWGLGKSTYSSHVIGNFQFLGSGLYLNGHGKFSLKAYFGEQKGHTQFL